MELHFCQDLPYMLLVLSAIKLAVIMGCTLACTTCILPLLAYQGVPAAVRLTQLLCLTNPQSNQDPDPRR